MAEALELAPARGRLQPLGEVILTTQGLSVWAGRRLLLRQIDLAIRSGQVLGIIGPSGAGKSTLLKCLNRLVELEPELRVEGRVELRGRSIFSRDPDELRTEIGILFQQPVVFPGSIYHNVLFGLRHLRRLKRRQASAAAEAALVKVGLWHQVKDRLHEPAAKLSAGQQQRLCLARTLAVEPEVLLMDEPTSALDPKSTQAIEALIAELKADHAVVLVTHDLQQARRVTDHLTCLCLRHGTGEVLESACCDELFENPRCRDALSYLDRE